MKTHLGAVIGRFQVANLSEGHMYLIEQALAQHRNVVVLVGSSQEWGTVKNPLNYATRARMIQDKYPQATVCPLPDLSTNERWSQNVDSTLRNLGWDLADVTLYAGRDSFKPYYSGDFHVVECDSGMEHVSGSALRQNIGRLILSSEDFRRGIIYATQNPPKNGT